MTWDALKHIQPNLERGEADILRAFDSNRNSIYEVAAKVYARGRRGPYNLVAADF